MQKFDNLNSIQEMIFKPSRAMPRTCIMLLLLALSVCLPEHPENQNLPVRVGQIVPGRIDPAVSNQNLHPLSVQKIENKFLFIRLSTLDANTAAMGLYSNKTGELLHSCMDNTYDTCYIPAENLAENTGYVVLVMSNVQLTYNLYTYWGNLEHLKPDQEIKFMFDERDKTQLFHLEFGTEEDWTQIRIVLRPETMRAQGDSLKIFGSLGLKEEPTQDKHDFASVHVWNDAEAIFLTKEDVGDKKGVTIYVVGNAKTIYILSCEFIRKDHHNLALNENIYEYIKGGKQGLYHMKFQQSKDVDVHVVRFSVFTGELEVGFYYDKQLERPFQKMPFQYMSDIQFHIEREDLAAGTQELYMKVRARDSACTFQLNVQGRKKMQGFQMYENVFEFVPVHPSQVMYFYSHIWGENQYDVQKVHSFDISLIKVQGESVVQFYLCKPNSNEQNCKDSSSELFKTSATELKVVGSQTVGSKQIYTVEIDQTAYADVNGFEKRALIVAEVKAVKNSLAYVAVQFSNPNKVRLLREGRAFEDKVRIYEKKYYKYVNDNPSVTMIKIHINEISGLTKITAKRVDTRLSEGHAIVTNPLEPNTITLTQNLTQPVFLQIVGLVTSIYTVSVSTSHREHPTSSSLIMAEDIEYEVKLLPYQHMDVEIHPIESEVVFEFACEGGSISICEIDANDVCKKQSEFMGNKGELKVNAQTAREVRIRLGNYLNATMYPNKSKAPAKIEDVQSQTIRRVKVTLRYRAVGNEHCQQRRINRVYSQVVKSGACLKFHLPLAADIEMLSSRENLGEGYQLYFLCAQKVVPEFSNSRYILRSTQISEACKDLPHDMNLQILLGDSSSHGSDKNDIRMDYSVEYVNDIVTLADGVAYTTRTYALEGAIKTFFYQINDEENSVEIVLINKKGIQSFFANVIPKPQRYSTDLSESEAKISSRTSNFFQNPTVEVTKQHIQKANCGRECVLVVSIFSSEKAGSEIEFAIEVTQNEVILKQDQIRTDFLAKGSVKYYEYMIRNPPTDLLFKVSDNNRRCTKIYMSNYPFPSSSNNLMIENQNVLVYKNASKGTYYFAVEAIDNCPYSVSISEQDSKLTKIEYGQYYDIQLKEGEGKWFYLKHLSKGSFKILSLLRHGLVEMRANSTDLGKDVLIEIAEGKADPQKFLFRDQYQNALAVDAEDKNFCSNCYYLVYIKAKTLTEGSIFFGSQNSKVLLENGKVLFDEIKAKNNSTFAIFYKVSNGTLRVNVHSGKVKVEMSYESQSFSESFATSKSAVSKAYSFLQEPGKYTPIAIKITAEQGPAVYSLELIPFANPDGETKLNPGETSEVYLRNGSEVCFSGVLRAKAEEIYLSADADEKVDMGKLDVKGKLNGKQSKIIKQTIGNIIAIKFQISETFFAQALKYQICISSPNKQYSLALNALQNQKTNLLPADTEVMVRKISTLAIHHSGNIIMDLFECRGKANIITGSALSELNNKEPKMLDVMGIAGQNHAIRVEAKEVTFVKVEADLATLLWMPLDEKSERGIGYYKYAIGQLSFNIIFNRIDFLIGGVFAAKDTKTSVQSVRYTLYIANNSDSLQQGLMCQQQSLEQMLVLETNSTSSGAGKAPEITLSIPKSRLAKAFPKAQTLHFSVVADLTLLPPSPAPHEHYRFLYYGQSVPAALFAQSYIENMNTKLLIGLVVVSVVGCLLIGFVFVRFVVPAIGRLRNRVLVEEGDEREMEVPQSSDRNQMQAKGTDQQLN